LLAKFTGFQDHRSPPLLQKSVFLFGTELSAFFQLGRQHGGATSRKKEADTPSVAWQGTQSM
jgi:hypothetical protein